MRPIALAGLAAIALLAPAFAGESPPESSVSALRSALAAAHEMVNAGRSSADPKALIAAARMLKRFPDRVLAPGQSGRDGADYDVGALLAEAGRLASGDPALRAEINGLSAEPGPASSDEWWEQVCDADGNCQWVRWVCTSNNICRQVEE